MAKIKNHEMTVSWHGESLIVVNGMDVEAILQMIPKDCGKRKIQTKNIMFLKYSCNRRIV
jgi:hypothetical protein